MSHNPHTEMANSCYGAISSEAASEFNEQLRADALIQATLALAWETARCADEARTANQIALLQPIAVDETTTVRTSLKAALKYTTAIHTRLYPEGLGE